MSSYSSPIFHGIQAALGASIYDVENGCIDTWNCWKDLELTPEIATTDMSKRGYDNFYIELSKYADQLTSYYNNLVKMHEGKEPEEVYDGLFSLDVDGKFGEWFAKYIMEHKEAPGEIVALNAIQEIVEEYMSHPAKLITINPDMLPPKQE